MNTNKRKNLSLLLGFCLTSINPSGLRADDHIVDIEAQKINQKKQKPQRKSWKIPLILGTGSLLAGSATTAYFQWNRDEFAQDGSIKLNRSLLENLTPDTNQLIQLDFEGVADDFVEQRQLDKKVFKGSSDLELPYEANRGGSFSPPAGGFDQVVGLHFSDILIPPDASILSSELEFAADERSSGSLQLKISGNKNSNAPNFLSSDIISRPETQSSVTWQPDDWNSIGSTHSSSDIRDIVQEIVQVPGWDSGHSMVIKLERSPNDQGKNTRVATNQPKLKVQFIPQILARGDHAKAGEGKEQAFDGSENTKWLDFSPESWIQYNFPINDPVVVSSYKLTSANDAPRRDPKDWQLIASNDGVNWELLDEQSDVQFSNRFQQKSFIFSNARAYSMYRLVFTANHGANIIQLAEIKFSEETGKQFNEFIPAFDQGLVNTFYKGSWSMLPDFSKLTPSITQEPNPSVIETIGLHDFAGMDQFALVQSGYIHIAKAGKYNFKLTSDDGSKLYINNKELINNDGMHGTISKYKKIYLDPGLYPFKIEYFEAHSQESLSVSYSVDDQIFKPVGKDMIFHSQLTRNEPDTHALQPGLKSTHYEGEWSKLPNFEDITPPGYIEKNTRIVGTVGLESYENQDYFALVQRGYIYITSTGTYTFKLTSDDGSRLLLDDQVLIDNDGLHGATPKQSNPVHLSQGFHPLSVEFFDRRGHEFLELAYKEENGHFMTVPSQLLFHEVLLADKPEPPEDPHPDDPDSPDKPAQEFELPVEVLGKEGKEASRSITLDASMVNEAEYLWLTVNNLSYENKASIKVNNGPWTPLNHQSVSIEKQELARGGMTHGGYNTIRLKLAVKDWLRTGKNTIQFRFNYSDGLSIGFRVVDFNLLNKSLKPLLEAASFTKDDPANWSQPYDDPDKIAEGKRLWQNANLISNYISESGSWYQHKLPARQPINAKCADCHTKDGRDLEIFSYSNLSIIERSKFHGLSEEEGKMIASYIRSLSSEHEFVGRYGRPWNPPYQPGPSIADRPVHEWAAGAGLEAVLEEDQDMLQGMFGKMTGFTQEDVERYFDSDQMWDTSQQAIAIQLPDWKHWLPIIHPKDAFSRSDYYLERNKRYDPEKAYADIRSYLTEKQGAYTSRSLFHELHKFWQNYRLFLTQGSNDPDHWRTTDGDPFTLGLKNGVAKELAATSLARHLAVKYFELHQKFQLEGLAPELIDPSEQPRERSWLGYQYNVFEVPAHFTACFKTGRARCVNFEGQDASTGNFESTAWYHLQQVINPGIATSRDVVPVDYNYMPTLILRASSTSGINEPVRYYFSSNVMYQTRTRSAYFTPNDREGFNMRTMGPWLFYGSDNRNHFQGTAEGEMPKLLNDIQDDFGVMVVNAQLKQFLKEMDKDRNSLSLWNRRTSSDRGEHRALDPVSLTNNDMPALDRPFSGRLHHYAHKIFWVIPKFINFGVDCELIDELKAWAKRAWPRVNWDRFECEERD